jgi:hypothetical protein
MRARWLWLSPLALAGTPAAAQVTEAWQPPTLTTVRYDERWDQLADPSKQTGDWTEKLKYIPLDDSGRDYLSTGLEWRERVESYHDNLWGSGAAPNDSYLWSRLVPYADLHLGMVRGFVQPILSYATGVSPSASPIDQTRLDMLQAFADIEVPVGDHQSLLVRGGREMMSLGTERLVGTRYGPNTPLAFDGGRAIWKSKSYRITAFYVRPVQAGPHTFDDATSKTKALWGVYGNHNLPLPKAGFDLYYLGYRNDNAHFDHIAGREHRQTLGMRFYGNAPEVHWNIEAIYQFGHVAQMPIRAWSLGTEVGHRFAELRMKPDFTLRFNVASGDKSGRSLNTFNAMFPKGKYFGELSPVGPYNIVNINPGTSFDLGHGFGLGIVGQAYWRESLSDGIYDIPGNLLRTGTTSRARFIGKQIEATLEWQATKELTLSTSLSAFEPGRFIKETGSAKTIRMLGLEANFRY